MATRQAPRTPQASRTHFDQIDGLRAFTAVGVMVTHVCYRGEELGLLYGRLAYPLRACVPVFCMISGFLLYRPMFRARWLGQPARPLRQYAVRRLVRIVPGYWVALTLGGLLLGVPGVFGPHWWVLYGFGQIYSYRTSGLGIGPAWTLCVDMTFYVVLPLISALCAWFAAQMANRDAAGSPSSERRPIWHADVAILGLLALASVAFRFYIQTRDILWVDTLPTTFAYFVPGMLLAVASVVLAQREASALPRSAAFITAHPAACWLASWALFAIDAIFVNCRLQILHPHRLTGLHYLLDDQLLIWMAALAVAPAMLGSHGGGWPRRCLALPAVAWLGLVSYGFYLWHFPLIHYFERHGVTSGPLPSTPTLLVVTLVAGAAYGAASWYGIERPFMRRFTRTGDRRVA